MSVRGRGGRRDRLDELVMGGREGGREGGTEGRRAGSTPYR